MAPRRRIGLALVAIGVLLAAIATLWWTSPRIARGLGALSSRVVFRVGTADSLVALTVDDGPSEVTSRLLDLLARHRARATFFVLADRAKRREALVRRIVAEGHELGNHLVRDRPTWILSRDEVRASVRRADSVLSRHGGSRWLRPGAGWVDGDVLAVAEEEGHRVALGSVYPVDAWIHRPRVLASFVLRKVRPGSVIVLHEGPGRGAATVETLGRVLPALRARGYRVVKLGRLVEAAGAEESPAGGRDGDEPPESAGTPAGGRGSSYAAGRAPSPPRRPTGEGK